MLVAIQDKNSIPLKEERGKAMKKLERFLSLLTFIVFFASPAFCSTYYVCNDISTCNAGGGSGWSGTPSAGNTGVDKAHPISTVQSGLAKLGSGDILIIGNGIYTGSTNIINDSHHPPSGPGTGVGVARFTQVKADVDGGVAVDGGGSSGMFDIESTTMHWIHFRGITWRHHQGLILIGSDVGSPSTYIWFLKCGSDSLSTGRSNNKSWYLIFLSYGLFEECFAWGDGRYMFQTFRSDHLVFRRCVVRNDYSGDPGGSYPVASFQMYDTIYSFITNCIVIDVDDDYFHDYDLGEGAFDTHAPNYITTRYINYDHSIALNLSISKDQSMGHAIVGGLADGTDLTLSNNVYWGLTGTSASGYASIYGSGSSIVVDHCTFGRITSSGGLRNSSTTTNNIFNHVSGTATVSTGGTDYNAFHGNGSIGTQGTHAQTAIDPEWTVGNPTGSLKYPIRIESGSNLSGLGSGGTDIGASIVNRIGTDGTFYGETGYNTDTGISLWPFPHEDTIKTQMSTYNNPSGPSATRGFCGYSGKDGVHNTLTTYIWEYLGNQIPAEIYGGGVSIPTLTGVQIIGGTEVR